MRGTDLIVPVGPHQEEVSNVRVDDQMLEEVESRRIQPLQIIQEEREGMLRPSEHGEEPPEHRLEAGLCLLRGEVRNRWLFSDDELEFGDQIYNKCAA